MIKIEAELLQFEAARASQASSTSSIQQAQADNDPAIDPQAAKRLQKFPVDVSGTICKDGNILFVDFLLQGNIQDINYDSPVISGQRTDKLWETTCFELFVKETDKKQYWEYNFAPSNNWNVFTFDEYRKNKKDETSINEVPINTRLINNQLTGIESSLPLPVELHGKKLKIGMSCILHSVNDGIYYYALAHNNPQPDFHDDSGFLILL